MREPVLPDAMAQEPVPLVLVVDDDVFIRRPLELILRQQGYATSTATDGEECLRRIGDERPDLIVMDVMMPGRDGFEICRALRAVPDIPRIPVILLTGRDEEGDADRARQAGADALMNKPYTPSELLGAVQRLVDPNRTGESR